MSTVGDESHLHCDVSNARLCHIRKWDHFDGYGFNLHAEKGKPGQYIGKVDEDSPAEAAGLRQGDRILEVNGESIASKTHKQVVELIKMLPSETKLLVIDPDEQPPYSIVPSAVPVVAPAAPKSAVTIPVSVPVSAATAPVENNGTTLNLSMTAAELRAKLASRKKFDPKKESMDFKQKFDIVQKL